MANSRRAIASAFCLLLATSCGHVPPASPEPAATTLPSIAARHDHIASTTRLAETLNQDNATLAPLLRPLLDSPVDDVADAAAAKLGTMEEAGVLQFIDALKSPNVKTRLRAVRHFSPLDPADGSAEGQTPLGALKIRGLAQALDDHSNEVVQAAITRLFEFKLRGHPALVRAIAAGNETVRAQVVTQMLKSPSYFTESFIRRVEFPLGGVRTPIELMPVEIELGRLIAPDLISKAGSPREAVDALSYLPQVESIPAVSDYLLAALSDHWYFTQRDAMTMILHTTSPSPAVQDRLEQMVSDFEKNEGSRSRNLLFLDANRDTAVTLIAQAPPDSSSAVSALAAAVSDPTHAVRRSAIVGLRNFNENADSALPMLLPVLRKGPADEAEEAAKTMLNFGQPGRNAALEFYLGKLADAPNHQAVIDSCRALAVIGPAAAGAVPALENWLSDHDNTLRMEVAAALGKIGPAASEAIPALTRMSDNPDIEVRNSAADALVQISPDGKGLAPALMAAVYNGDKGCVARLAAALQHADHSRVLQARLDDLAGNDPEEPVRAAARQAVKYLMVDAPPGPATRPAE